MKTKLTNGQKLAPQFRTAKIELKVSDSPNAKGADMDLDNRIVRGVSVSSDEPYERYYGMEILSHEPGACDLARVTSAAAPLLYNHDRDALLGKISNPQLRDGKLYVDFKFSSSEAGNQALKDLQDGILTECSIGYDVNKFEVDEDKEEYRATKWTLYEASLVTIPADFKVGVGRQSEDASEVEIETKPKKDVDGILKNENESHSRENSPAQPTKNMDPLTPEQIEAKAAEAKALGQTEERKRVKSIQDLTKHYSEKGLGGRKIDTSELAAKFIEDGGTVAEFRDAVMDGTFKDVKPIQTPDNDGRIEVVGERGQRKHRSIGAEFVGSKEFKDATNSRRRSVSKEFEIGMLGIRGKVALAQRAGFTSSDLSAVNVDIQTGVVGLGLSPLTIMDLIAPGATGAAAVIYPRENSYGTVDGVAVDTTNGIGPRGKTVGERGLKPLWDPDLTSETANVKKVAVTTKVPDEFMADFPASQSYIDERLPYMVDEETEFQILYGDGLGNNLKGIFSTSGIQTRAITTTDDSTIAASLMQGLTDIQVNSHFMPTGYAFHPYDWETAKLLKDTNKRFLYGGPFYIPYSNGVVQELYTFWGKPVVVSTSVEYGKPLAGAWKLGAQYFQREGMRLEMTNANEDDFRRNLVAIRAEHRLALATYRPVAFLQFTGFPARA